MTTPELPHVTVRESCTGAALPLIANVLGAEDAYGLLRTPEMRDLNTYTVAGFVDTTTAGCIVARSEELDGLSSPMRLVAGYVMPEHEEFGVFGAMFEAVKAEALQRGHDKLVVRGSLFPAMLGALAEHGFGFAGHDEQNVPFYERRLP